MQFVPQLEYFIFTIFMEFSGVKDFRDCATPAQFLKFSLKFLDVGASSIVPFFNTNSVSEDPMAN